LDYQTTPNILAEIQYAIINKEPKKIQTIKHGNTSTKQKNRNLAHKTSSREMFQVFGICLVSI